MAGTASSVVENNVRLLLRDARLNDTAIGSFQLKRLIENRVNYVSGRLGGPETRTTSVAMTGAYELTVNAALDSLASVIDDAFARPLIKVTEEDIDSFRRGGGTIPTAPPIYYCPIWRDGNVWKLQIHPPGASGTLTLVADLQQAGLADDGTTLLDFDNPTLRGLEQLVAADAVPLIIPEKAVERGLSAAAVRKWEQLGEAAVTDAWARVNQGRLRDSTVVRMGSWRS